MSDRRAIKFQTGLPNNDDALSLRSPPHNFEAEVQLLGAILANNRAWESVSEFLQPEHFTDPRHARIFEACGKLIGRGQIASATTLNNFFEQDATLTEIGGPAYLGKLAAAAVTVINAVDHGRIVQDLYLRRQLIGLGEDIVNRAYAHDLETAALDQAEKAEAELFAIVEKGKGADAGSIRFGEAVTRAVETAQRVWKGEQVQGIPTDLAELDDLLGALEDRMLYILAGRPSMGKAQPLDAKVLTPTGWKRMGDLKLGDKLASLDGGRSVVAGIYPQGEQQLYRVTFSDGRSTEACGEHLWRIHHRKWPKPRVIRTLDLIPLISKPGGWLRHWVDYFPGQFGHTDPLPIDPWLLGVLLGDGGLTGSTIKLTTADPEILAGVQSALTADLQIKKASGDNYDFRISSARRTNSLSSLRQALDELGIGRLGSHERFVPEIYLSACRETRLAVLQGLLDTDGWAEKHGSVLFSSTSEHLADDVVTLARSIGAWARKRGPRIPKCNGVPGRPSWTVTIAHEAPSLLFRLPRKKLLARDARWRRKMPAIVSIEKTRAAPAQCIAVTHPSHLYVTDDFIVTHNTALAERVVINVARRLAREQKGSVAVFSLDMTAEQWGRRAAASEANLDLKMLKAGRLTKSEWIDLANAQAELAALPIHIDDRDALTGIQIRSSLRRMIRRHNVRLGVVDHLTLLARDPTLAPRASTTEIVARNSFLLKSTAKQLGIPLLVLCQLSRANEQREDKRPTLADLRWAGEIEQDAHAVMFVHRDHYYLERSKPHEKPGQSQEKFLDEVETWQRRMNETEGRAEINIAKNQDGPVGTCEVGFRDRSATFYSLKKPEDEEVLI